MQAASLYVEQGGLCTTVQDIGRFGYQSIGIPVSGALDQYALRLTNALVGNEPDCAALEIRLLGPTIRVMAERVRIALSGTNTAIRLLNPERRDLPSNRSVTLTKDALFQVKTSTEAVCCYLAIEGGFDIEPVLGSCSTYLKGKLGGFHGREIQAGDHLPLLLKSAGDRLEQQIADFPVDRKEVTTLRVVPGPQADYFTATGMQTFYSSRYTVTTQLDRMGMRLSGPAITHANGFNIPSDGIVTGAIQVPGDGTPIVLLADRQTTGGYPKIGCVISADIPKLAQLSPGSIVQFNQTTSQHAEHLRNELEASFLSRLKTVQTSTDAVTMNDSRLLRENLISGGEWLLDE